MHATIQTPSGAVVAQGSQAPASITVIGTDGKPQTLVVPHSPAEMTQLMDRRRQLSDELNNVTDRRNGLVEQIRTAPNVAEAGLTAQLKVLDDRIVQLGSRIVAEDSMNRRQRLKRVGEMRLKKRLDSRAANSNNGNRCHAAWSEKNRAVR